ncbi:MAG: DUF3472 domain-containing protein [Pirellulales bacterium]
MKSTFVFSLAVGLIAACLPSFAEEIRVPAFTAYMLPNPESARFSEQSGVTRWTDASQSLNWYGQFQATGTLTAKVLLQPESGAPSKLKLTIDGKSVERTADANDKELVTVDFGTFELTKTGYQRIQLESTHTAYHSAGRIDALLIDGVAAVGAHFNLKERRNAASVHLSYPVPDKSDVAAFYTEVTGIEDPTSTFYMACGWHRGYFGMQVNSPTERRIIFSVWDSGNEAVSRDKVQDDNRVKLMGKGEGVYTGDFGNEGTGGHSHLKFLWKTGTVQKFVVTAEPIDKTFTIYSGHWYHPDKQEWMLISSWKAPKEGGYMRGLHSFSENFWGSNGHLPRKALYGNQWIRTAGGEWKELTSAKFSHDPTGKTDRLDRYMGVESGQFFLSHGGFIEGFTKFGEPFERPALSRPPELPTMVIAR